MINVNWTWIVSLCFSLMIALICGCHGNSSSAPGGSTSPTTSVYVADFGGAGNVYHCTLDSTALTLTSCAANNGGVTSWEPSSVTTAAIGSSTYAYVSSYVTGVSGDVFKCAVDASSGSLSGCAVSDGGVTPANWQPSSVEIVSLSGGSFAYVADWNGHIYVCSVTAGGDLSGCAISDGGASGWSAAWITVKALGGSTYAYVADYGGHVDECTVNTSTGALSGCAVQDGGASGWTPTGITIDTIGSTTYAYVADFNGSKVYVCTVNSTTGNLSGCAVSNGGISTWQPSSFEFYSPSTTPYLYVADGGAGHVYKCQLSSSNGTLSSCTATDGGAPAWTPYGVSIH